MATVVACVNLCKALVKGVITIEYTAILINNRSETIEYSSEYQYEIGAPVTKNIINWKTKIIDSNPKEGLLFTDIIIFGAPL